MDKHESSQKWKRIAMSFFGVIVTGFCIGAFQKANLGADPFTCFVTGIANIFHSTYSTFYIIVTGALLVGVFFVEKHYIGIATVINLFFTGMAADFMRNILDNIFPAPGMAARFVMMLFGIFGTCFAASVYFTADLGVSAYDAWSLIAANKYKLMPFRLCRIASDSVCVLWRFSNWRISVFTFSCWFFSLSISGICNHLLRAAKKTTVSGCPTVIWIRLSVTVPAPAASCPGRVSRP